MNKALQNVLIIPSWYPNRHNPGLGSFVKKHALKIAEKRKVYVFNFVFNKGNSDIEGFHNHEKFVENQIEEHHHLVNTGNSVLKSARAILKIYLNFLRLMSNRKKLGIGIIHLHVPYKNAVILYPLLLFYRLPIYITDHWSGYFPEDGRFLNSGGMTKFILKKLFYRAKNVSVVSHALKDALLTQFPSLRRISIIPNVIDCNIQPAVEKKKGGMTSFLFIGNFVDREKNISGILRAFKTALSSNEKLFLHLVGDGPGLDDMVKLKSELNIPDSNIEFHGFIDNKKLSEIYSHAHCYIMNSYFETFSISTAEALLHGIPVICTRCKGPEEFVDKSNGILIDVDSEPQLTKAILQMSEKWMNFNPNAIANGIKSIYCQEISGLFEEFYINNP